VYPSIAAARAVRRAEARAQLLFIGRESGMERTMAEPEGIRYASVASAPFPGKSPASIVRFCCRMLRGVRQARRILSEWRAAVVFGAGGYASVPPIIAAARLRIPCAIHEQNVIPGRANRFVSRYASRVLLSFEAARDGFAGCDVVTTGMPVREEFADPPSRDEARRRLGIPADARVLLVTGGSQGALALNRFTWDVLGDLLARGWTVLHLCGEQGIEQAGRVRERLADPAGYRPAAFSNEMAAHMAAADLALSRAGASSVAEMACCGLPAVLVPYPHSPTGDQLANATQSAEAGAAIVVEQMDLTREEFLGHLDRLIGDPGALEGMRAAARRSARPDAAHRVAAELLVLAAGG
jgi:UDP-N-acetylglucosamine--N-acetylmuramyl-(pentapeptide) pyrophosphoryl-undecaprenol N-acetylglucosamine transferase